MFVAKFFLMESPLPPPIEGEDERQAEESGTNPNRSFDFDPAALSRQEVRIGELIEPDYFLFLSQSLLKAQTSKEILHIIDAALGLQSPPDPKVKKR